MRNYEGVSKQLWLCGLKYNYAVLTTASGSKEIMSMDELKFFINSYETWLEVNNLKVDITCNDTLNAHIDDRLPRFMKEHGFVSIDFKDEIRRFN